MCVREAGGVTAVLTVIRLSVAGRTYHVVSRCACEGECVAVLRSFISDLLPYILL